MQQFPAGSYGKAHADKELLLAWLFNNAGPDNANWFYVLSRRRRPKRSLVWSRRLVRPPRASWGLSWSRKRPYCFKEFGPLPKGVGFPQDDRFGAQKASNGGEEQATQSWPHLGSFLNCLRYKLKPFWGFSCCSLRMPPSAGPNIANWLYALSRHRPERSLDW